MFKQQRVVIDNIQPQLECGLFNIKRVIDEMVRVTADILPDGHDVMRAELCYKHEKQKTFDAVPMSPTGNDGYVAAFKVVNQGYYEYKIIGWVDYALNWQHGILAKLKDGQYVRSELLDGIQYLEHLKNVAKIPEIKDWITKFNNEKDYQEAVSIATSARLHDLFVKHPQRLFANESKTLKVYVDRKKASFSTWYEFFPRSASPVEGKHGTFKDCEALLPRIASMGFDTLYFPPIHPIGEVNRKGKNNTVNALPGDTGVPWAIGSKYGGHKSIHPELGTEKDFIALVQKAKDMDIEIAMDIAFQAAPDHPYIKEHPEWFRKRPDGTIQYAENPPKKYQDIVNFYFESQDYKALWKELLDVVLHWVKCGVSIFRVDNPHTKPYYFWGWLIGQVKKKHPDVLFLAEAFSRPRIMQQLAKQGFCQSYTYFTWRESKKELEEYITELTQSEMREYYRPNFWPNTPDINPYYLQRANESMHMIRYSLAATLCGNIGIYGPVYEQMVSEPLPNKEEYLDCEKYQIRHWDWHIENRLTRTIRKLNLIRKELPALQQTNNIRLCFIENQQLMAFYKWNEDRTSEVLVVISLDCHYTQEGYVQLPLDELRIGSGHRLELHDMVTGNHYIWFQEWNYVRLSPQNPIHLFQIKK